MLAKKKRPEGVAHTFDSNGALVVNAYSLLMSAGFRKQLNAARAVVLKSRTENGEGKAIDRRLMPKAG